MADVVESLSSGRSFITNGPIVELTINDRHLPGDTLSAVEGEVEIRFEEARVYVNRETERVLPVEASQGGRTIIL
jgi:hypothetical protein